MSIKEEKICRVCFNVVENEFENVDETTRTMFDILQLKLNWDISQSPIICKNCADVTKKSVYFISVCAGTEEHIHNFAVGKNEVKFELKDIYNYGLGEKPAVDEDVNVCRCCMNKSEESDLTLLDVLLTESMYMEMLPIYMHGMDLNSINNPAICTPCRENLDNYFKFVLNCLEIEDKINTYYQQEGINGSQIELGNLLHLFCKNNQEYEIENLETYAIKEETEQYEDMENVFYFEADNELIKSEEILTIKEEQVDYCEYIDQSTLDKIMEVSEDDSTYKNNKVDIKPQVFPSDTETYNCNVCTYITACKIDIVLHILNHQNSSEAKSSEDTSEVEEYKCILCTYNTNRKNYYISHMLTHKHASQLEKQKPKVYIPKKGNVIVMGASDLKNYKCRVCHYKAQKKINYDRHMLGHKYRLEIGKYKCSSCFFRTKYKENLKAHLLSHKKTEEVSMFMCTLCNYETIYSANLKKHLKVHETEYNGIYTCGVCPYQTKWKQQLSIHVRTHGEFHKCDLCAFQTCSISSYNLHMQEHGNTSGGEVYKCGMCSFESKYKNSVKIHIMRQHIDKSGAPESTQLQNEEVTDASPS